MSVLIFTVLSIYLLDFFAAILMRMHRDVMRSMSDVPPA